MKPEFWLSRWQENRIGFHRADENPLLVRHWPDVGGPTDVRVLVPLCGKSLDLEWLALRGHRVAGVELSRLAAEAFFTEAGLSPQSAKREGFEVLSSGNVEIWVGDYFQLDARTFGSCEALYDRAALIALPPELRKSYVETTASLLAPGARGLLLTLEYVEGTMDGPPFSVPESEVRELYLPRFDVEAVALGDVEPTAPRFADRGLRATRDGAYRLTRR